MNYKRIVFNQIVDNKGHIEDARVFLGMVEKHLGKLKGRRFRLIIEELVANKFLDEEEKEEENERLEEIKELIKEQGSVKVVQKF